MPLPRSVARANRAGFNHVMRRLAPHLPGFALLEHRGRRSGRTFTIPVNVFPHEGTVRIALTYGSGSDWVRNVVAADGCRILVRGRAFDLVNPRVVRDPERSGMPPGVRFVLGRLRVEEFLDLDRTDPGRA